MHDSANLLDKLKHHNFWMQCADAKFSHNDVLELSFAKPLTRKDDKVAELVEEECTEWFDL